MALGLLLEVWNPSSGAPGATALWSSEPLLHALGSSRPFLGNFAASLPHHLPRHGPLVEGLQAALPDSPTGSALHCSMHFQVVHQTLDHSWVVGLCIRDLFGPCHGWTGLRREVW